jgi:Protein of unknown function (DUF1552)
MAYMSFNGSLPRRSFLRNVGISLALPFLDAMVPARARAAVISPRRMGFVYVPNGIMLDEWTPASDGTNLTLSRILSPLEPFHDAIVVVSGLGNPYGGHSGASAGWLVPHVDGGWRGPKQFATALEGHITIDQVAAQHLGQETQLGSLELGLEGSDRAGDCDVGFSCAYTNSISWHEPSTPNPMETDPRAVFERLFGDDESSDPRARLARLQKEQSILDSVAGDVRQLAAGLGSSDKGKLDQYLDTIRDVERRIQMAESRNVNDVTNVVAPAATPEKFEDYCRLMFDLQALALQTDSARVTTFMIGREVSSRSYPEIGVPDPHHATSHHQYVKEKVEKNTKINTFHMEQFAYFLNRLKSVQDGDGTLLDHSILMYGAGLSEPNIHSHVDLPVVVVAGSSTGIKGGRHLRYPANSQFTGLLLSLLDKAGVPFEEAVDGVKSVSLLSDF